MCQSLSEKNIEVSFIINGDKSINSLLPGYDVKIFNWKEKEPLLINLLLEVKVIFIDSILINKKLYDKISSIVENVFYIDDYHKWSHKKGIIIDWTVLSDKKRRYETTSSVKYLLGTKYAALRKEFWDIPKRHVSRKIENILLTFGGSDIRNLTIKMLRLINDTFPQLKITIIVGNSYNNVEEIEDATNKNIKLIYSANAAGMKKNMLKADIAIASGGQTIYELARIGVPTIGIISVDNQLDDINGWEETGFLMNAGWWCCPDLEKNIVQLMKKCINKNRREEMIKIGRSFIDGQGAKRIADNIISG